MKRVLAYFAPLAAAALLLASSPGAAQAANGPVLYGCVDTGGSRTITDVHRNVTVTCPTGSFEISWQGLQIVSPSPSPSVSPSPSSSPSPSPSPSSGSCPQAQANAAGGPDPWGGCFPGPGNTGVPPGTNLVSVDGGSATPPPGNTGWEWSTSGYLQVTAPNAVMAGISDTAGVYVPAGDSLTITDSATGLINDEGTSLDVENSTLNGGNQATYATISGGSNITVKGSDLSGGMHEVLCYGNCDVENSYLHDNYTGDPSTHQDGLYLSGDGFTITHNTVGCTGGCTADVGFLDHSATSNANVENNLLLTSPDSAFCVYPGPNSSTSVANNMVWENNVFQKGANGQCATYGPVYGWYPNVGTGNVWSGNTWDDGSALNAG
jgi:FlaG/FlaF family flagellin (archaellin)